VESQAEGRTRGSGDHEGNKQDTAGKYSACTRSRTFPGQEEHSGTVMLNSVRESLDDSSPLCLMYASKE